MVGSMGNRVFIIGWDGATFDLIRPWVAAGKLPNIARLMAQGVHGPLRSTIPPMTFPAWSSFMTGKNPGKHGVFDFTRPRPGTYELEFVNGGQRRAATFWQLLSQAGRKVISISIPCTFPPEPVNGVMISGFDAPGLVSGQHHVDAGGMYPPDVYDELLAKVGPHPIGAFATNMHEINSGQPERAMTQVEQAIRQKAATAKYLLRTRDWDCAMILFGESDGAGHHFWKYCDPNSPLFQAEPAGMRNSIERVYCELDRQVGEMLDEVPPNVTVLMMSDHGFGGVSNWVIFPNCWLREKGCLGFRGGMTHWLSRAMDGFKMRAMTALPGLVKRVLYRLGKGRLGGFESRVRFGMIDWKNTQAYFEENPYYPSLWINLKGRQPQGTVEPGPEYEALRDRLIAELEAWRHPVSGEPIVQKAYRREEIYSGPAVADAPDIVVRWGLHKGYNYAFRLSSKSRHLKWIEQVDPHAPQNLSFFTGKSGHHREDGIFVAHGPAIRSGGSIEGARIIDLAPTILHLLDVPAPADMDGRVLHHALTQSHLAEHPLETARATEADGAVLATAVYDSGYSSADEEKIAERLKSLGYID